MPLKLRTFLDRVMARITEYVKQRGQQLVYVTIPQQNIADGAKKAQIEHDRTQSLTANLGSASERE